MIGYVFYKESKIINGKIDNVSYIGINEIRNDNMILNFGNGSDYIILKSDTINLNKDDIIDITKLEDCRDFFLSGEDKWNIKKLQEQNNKLQDINAKTLFVLMNGGIL